MSDAGERFLNTLTEQMRTRAVSDDAVSKLILMARWIHESEQYGFVIDADSVEEAVKRVVLL